MRTRDQELASTVYSQVCTIKDFDEKQRAKYGSMAHKLPVLIRKAGLCQSLAFIEDKKEPMHICLLRHLSDAIGAKNLSETSREADLRDYMRLTKTVLTALTWYKRFASSVLEIEGDSEPESVGG